MTLISLKRADEWKKQKRERERREIMISMLNISTLINLWHPLKLILIAYKSLNVIVN